MKRSPPPQQQRQAHEAALQGRYSLVAVRGNGQSAEVWEARHRLTGVKVAVKIICLAKSGVPMAKVEREILVMRLLRHHPHIVHLYEAVVSSDNKAVYLVMELAEQGELFYYVTARQRLPEDEARRVFRQVAGGVSFCHRNMVVHRDLKMDNILLDSEHNVKIADFGFSKLFRYSKVLSSFCGSPDYAAPEMHDGRQYIGPEVDVWSCGVILYTMLCGNYPFHGGDDIARLQRNIRRGDFRLPGHLSDQARDLISGMLIVNPDKRMTMDKVMEHPWLLMSGCNNNNVLPPRHTHHHQEEQQAAMEEAVARCGVDRNALLHALRNGLENEATVAYHLILRTLWCHHNNHNNNLLCRHHQPPAPGAGWSLPGVDVGDDCPRQTMLHIAEAAKELGILCGHQSPTNLLCAAASSPQHQQDAVFFEIQLYRPEAENKNNYVVDLKRLSGPQLDYLRICSHLASKLRQIYPSS